MPSFFRSSLMISILTLLLSIVSFINQMIIASYFGTGVGMDNYLFVSSFPFMLSGIIASGFSFSLVPHFVNKDSLYFNYFFKIVAGIGVILTIILFFIYYFIVIPYFELYNFEYIYFLNLLIWLVFYVTILFSVISCYYTSKSKFIVPVILNFLPYTFSILGILIFHNFGVLSIVLGSFIGYVCCIGYSLYLFFIKENINFLTFDSSTKKDIFTYLSSMKYTILSMLTFSIFQVVDSYWGEKLGTSAISYLGYSQRIIIAVGAMVIAGPSSVLIPRLTNAYKIGDLSQYYKDTSTIIIIVFALTSFATLIGSFFSVEIIRMMFQRGSFNEVSTKNVASILPYMLLGMNFMLCTVISFRSIFVQNINIKTAIIGLLTAITYFLLSGILSHYFAIMGIAYSYIITWLIILTLTTYFLFDRQFKTFFEHFLIFIIKQLVALATCFLIIYLLNKISTNFFTANFIFLLGDFIKIVLISIVAAIVYVITSVKIMKIKELQMFFNKIPLVRIWIQ